MSKTYALTKLLNQKGYLCYNRYVAKKLGVNTAVLFAELVNLSDMFNGSDFFFSQEKIADDTALSKHQVQEGIKALVDRKILSVEKKGLPCRNWYAINIENALLVFEEQPASDKENEPQDVKKLDNLQSNDLTACDQKNEPLLSKEIHKLDTELETKREKGNSDFSFSEQNFPAAETPESRSDTLQENPDANSLALSYSQKHFARLVYDEWEKADLPRPKSGFIGFVMSDFRLALSDIGRQRLHSDDVIQACRNYAEVVALKRSGWSWWNQNLSFDRFARPSTIRRFLPDYFDIEEYKIDGGRGSTMSRSGEHSNVEVNF